MVAGYGAHLIRQVLIANRSEDLDRKPVSASIAHGFVKSIPFRNGVDAERGKDCHNLDGRLKRNRVLGRRPGRIRDSSHRPALILSQKLAFIVAEHFPEELLRVGGAPEMKINRTVPGGIETECVFHGFPHHVVRGSQLRQQDLAVRASHVRRIQIGKDGWVALKELDVAEVREIRRALQLDQALVTGHARDANYDLIAHSFNPDFSTIRAMACLISSRPRSTPAV